KALVDNPDKVKVSQLDGEQSSIIELKVAQEDLGKVIGKQGRNAQAIRVILGAAGMKLKKRVNLEILEKE
nr:KH domain-containing protein [Candidatus Aminicenantes bacterium]